MSCTSPLYRVPVGSLNYMHLTPYDRSRIRNKGVFLPYEALLDYKDMPGFDVDKVQIIPCGQCTSCRLAKSNDWAIRCSLEASMHEFNYFVTLTYDNEHLPSGEFVDYTGEIYDNNLCRRHIQLFIKNLREWERTTNNNTGIKVFYCGEYGGLTSRAHYHICLFGVSEIPDLRFSFKNGAYKYYKSTLYERFWSSDITGIKIPRGFVDISDVSFDSLAYTARYVLKKQQGCMKKDFLEYYSELEEPPELRTQPFVGMSLKPGIAAEYYEENKLQIRSEDLVKYQKKYELFMSKPPKYFDKLFDREDPEAFEEVKRKRIESATAARKTKSTLFSESELARMQHEAKIMKDKEDRYYVRRL